ncbi:TPA: hypothetical protein ACH3X1_000034 [Trebouxia sp. C0004]
MNPDWSTHTVSLLVQTGVGTNVNLLRHQPALPERQNSVKRGRDQASARGKASTIGQNSLLQTAASRRMRNISELLLARSGDEEGEYDYVKYRRQPLWAREIVIFLTSAKDSVLTYEETKTAFKKTRNMTRAQAASLWQHSLLALTCRYLRQNNRQCCMSNKPSGARW